MNAPIPVSDALKLLSMALDQEVWTSAEPWQLSWAMSKMSEQDAHFVVLARATMRPLLALVKLELVNEYGADESISHPHELLYPPLAALRDHYNAVRPGWRTE